jgi:hypothetical protein
MIKYFCDRCGKESKELTIIPIYAYDGLGNKIVSFYGKHLCEGCSSKLDAIRDQLEHEEDIFDMTDEDIELLRYTFNVGDKVITADGRSGIIKSICDCEQCKKRGFYEPNVTMTIGNDQTWITDTDKNNGFVHFYQIGKYIFGNVDHDASKRIRERLIELKHEVVEYEAQLNMLQKLENTNGN